MTAMPLRGRLLVIAFLGHFLIVLAAWTVTIKFLFPIAYALGQSVRSAPTSTGISGGWCTCGSPGRSCAGSRTPTRWRSGSRRSRSPIILTKFALFLPEPEWTIWTTNWFINKLFMLACFCLMLPYFGLYRRDLRQRPRFRWAPGLGGEAAQRWIRRRLASTWSRAVRHLDLAELLEGLGIVDRDVVHRAADIQLAAVRGDVDRVVGVVELDPLEHLALLAVDLGQRGVDAVDLVRPHGVDHGREDDHRGVLEVLDLELAGLEVEASQAGLERAGSVGIDVGAHRVIGVEKMSVASHCGHTSSTSGSP